MSRRIIATTAFILAIAFVIYRFVPIPAASANSGGGSTNFTLTLQFQGTGSVYLNPPNVTRTSGVTYSYAQGTVVNLSASAPAGWRFLRWENALTGSSSTGSITMTSNKTVKAVFVQCKLTVHKQGNGRVNIDPPDETLTPSFTKTYSGITNVELTAIPDAGWAFKEWTGDHTGTSNPANFQVDREETVTAVFEQIKLTVNKTGEGKVSATPPGGAAQTPSFTKYYGTNTTVSLAAIPEPGWAFKEWTGAISSTSNPASVLVNGDKTVRAVFEEIKLTVNKEGNGQVNINPPNSTQTPSFTQAYTTITNVTLTAIPEPGWAFVEWTGDVTGTDNPAEILVNAVKSVTAVFEERKLTVSKEGEGQVSAAPPGGAQTPTFTVNYGADVEVTLTALPASGWIFKEWTGDVTGTANPAEITVDREKAVSAVFEQIKLTVERSGFGNVTLDPPNVTQTPTFTQTYSSATTVTVTAIADTGWVFKEWTGDITSTDNPATINVSGEKTIRAVFEQRMLKVDKVGFGSVNVNPPDETLQPFFMKQYGSDTNVTLTAVSNIPDWTFKEWTGDVTSTSPTVTLMVDGEKSVTAVFEKIRLTVNKEGEGSVNVDPPDQTLSPPFYKDYEADEVVELTAIPDSGWSFKEWTGAASGTSPTVTVTMSGAKTVTAVFVRFKLEIAKEGEGRVGVDPPGPLGYNLTFALPFEQYYPAGQVVSITPVPQAGWGFQEWRGVKRGKEENNPLVLTMTDDDSITAVFAQVELNVDKEGEGQVAIAPPGGIQTLPFSQTLAYGTEVTLNATPASGWNFVRWEGDVPTAWAQNNPLEMALSGDTDLMAIFGSVTLTTDAEEGGTLDPEPGEHPYALADIATITATANLGWNFHHWEGDVPSEDRQANPLDLEMDEDKEVTAVFYVNLLVTQVQGATVDSLLGLNWGIPGWGANLQSTPAPGYEVSFWRITRHPGESNSFSSFEYSAFESESEPEDDVQYLVGEDVFYNVFVPTGAEPVPHPVGTKQLLVEHGFGGNVDVDFNSGDLIEEIEAGRLYLFEEGAQVSVEAVPDEVGYIFDVWEGEITPYNPEANPMNLTMDRDRHLKASFKSEVALTVDRKGRGRGRVTVNPPNISREPSFTETYSINVPVLLTATTEECGWEFDHWEGTGVLEGDEEDNPLGITMDDDKKVKAVFLRSGERAKIELSVLRPSTHGVDATHNGDNIPADQVFEPIVTSNDQIFMNGIVTITDSDYELVGAKMELQGYDAPACTSSALASTDEALFDGCTTKDLYATDHTPPNFATLVIPNGVTDLTTYRIVIYAKVRNITSGAESWDSIYDTVAFTHSDAVDVAHTIAGEEKSIRGYKEVAKSIKARWTFPYMEFGPYDFSRKPGKEMIRGANQIKDVARNPGIYNAAGKSAPGLMSRPQEARMEAVSVLEVGGDKDHPASYIEGGIYFFANDPAQRYEEDGTMNDGYRFILDAVAQGLLSLNTTQGNEYFYAVGPTWWTRPYLHTKYDANKNDTLVR